MSNNARAYSSVWRSPCMLWLSYAPSSTASASNLAKSRTFFG
jgi:hypothetical protein